MAAIPAPLDGSLVTVTDFTDFHATHNATLPWLIFPSKGSAQFISEISFYEMNKASHRVAHLLRPGRQGPEREVVAVIVNTDVLLYIAVLLGLLRAGFVVNTTLVTYSCLS